MKQKTEKRVQAKREDKWIDVHDDNLMISLGIRPPHLVPRDESVWTKSPYELRIVKSCKNSSKKPYHFHFVPRKTIPVFAKIVVQLIKNNKFPNTTYSKKIWQHEIGDFLSKFTQTSKKSNLDESLVLKYSYNGKTYSPTERPYWPGK